MSVASCRNRWIAGLRGQRARCSAGPSNINSDVNQRCCSQRWRHVQMVIVLHLVYNSPRLLFQSPSPGRAPDIHIRASVMCSPGIRRRMSQKLLCSTRYLYPSVSTAVGYRLLACPTLSSLSSCLVGLQPSWPGMLLFCYFYFCELSDPGHQVQK
jgi:hypothetical protein